LYRGRLTFAVEEAVAGTVGIDVEQLVDGLP